MVFIVHASDYRFPNRIRRHPRTTPLRLIVSGYSILGTRLAHIGFATNLSVVACIQLVQSQFVNSH